MIRSALLFFVALTAWGAPLPIRNVRLVARPLLLVGIPSGRTMNAQTGEAPAPMPLYLRGRVRISGGAVLR